MQSQSPLRLVWLVFWGFAISLAYGLCAGGVVYTIEGEYDAQQFLAMYIGNFNMLVTTGLIVATALIIGAAQNVIPDTIEEAFKGEEDRKELAKTGYFEQRKQYTSIVSTVSFASLMIIFGLVVLTLCRFPLSGAGQAFLLIGGCLQWALASYVGRKLRYAGMMIYSLLKVQVKRNLFRERELDVINTAVHVATTLTVVFVYLHIRSNYYGPFGYDGFLGKSAQVFLLLPAVIATPILVLFNFFPRIVIRRLYDKSIDIELETLQHELQNEALSPFEKRRKLMEFDKLYRDQLRYSLQLTLSDLPIGITVLIMVIQPLLKS
jgi:hypothetical protein